MYELLKKLLPAAEAQGLKLGIENRQGLEELPLESDFQFMFRELGSPAAVYWHDVGHGQIKENLGFIRHAMHLESLRGRLFGFHIHDVQFPGRDHCAPGTGMVDFTALQPSVKPEHIKVFELSSGLAVEEVKSGVAHVKQVWGDE
jgi:sugar phosphate isomerase/epimerase